MTEFERGDLVHYERGPDYANPMTVLVVYHNGRLRLEDQFGSHVVSVSPAAVTGVEA